MPTELDEARDNLIEILAQTVYQLASETANGGRPEPFRVLASHVDLRMANFVTARRVSARARAMRPGG